MTSHEEAAASTVADSCCGASRRSENESRQIFDFCRGDWPGLAGRPPCSRALASMCPLHACTARRTVGGGTGHLDDVSRGRCKDAAQHNSKSPSAAATVPELSRILRGVALISLSVK